MISVFFPLHSASDWVGWDFSQHSADDKPRSGFGGFKRSKMVFLLLFFFPPEDSCDVAAVRGGVWISQHLFSTLREIEWCFYFVSDYICAMFKKNKLLARRMGKQSQRFLTCVTLKHLLFPDRKHWWAWPKYARATVWQQAGYLSV